MDDDPIRDGCAVYVGYFVWVAAVLIAVNVWDIPNSPWVAIGVLGPLVVAWIAVWIARLW
jgi:hypothetical protein